MPNSMNTVNILLSVFVYSQLYVDITSNIKVNDPNNGDRKVKH